MNRESEQNDEMRSEYDLTQLQGGERGKYFRRFQAGTNLALLETEVRKAFPTDEAVNVALRSLMAQQPAANI